MVMFKKENIENIAGENVLRRKLGERIIEKITIDVDAYKVLLKYKEELISKGIRADFSETIRYMDKKCQDLDIMVEKAKIDLVKGE